MFAKNITLCYFFRHFFTFIKDVFSGEIIPNKTDESFKDKSGTIKPESEVIPECES